MGVKPEECGIGHPHIDDRILDACRLIVQRIDDDPERFHIALENLEGQRARQGRLSRASEEWLAILDRPWAEIRAILLDGSDEGQRLRSSHPFSGSSPRKNTTRSSPAIRPPGLHRTGRRRPRRRQNSWRGSSPTNPDRRDARAARARAPGRPDRHGRVRVRHHRQPSHPGAIPERSRGSPRLPGDRHLRPRQAGGLRLYPRGMRRTHRLPANARFLH